jgi:cell division protein FtsW
VRLLLFASFGLLVAVLAPGIGVDVNGARRWIGAGPIQFQPSEVMKIALILYVARYVADHPRRMRRSFKEAIAPIAVVVGPACLLIYVEPDLGTTLIVSATMLALLIAGGVPMRYVLALIGIAAVVVMMLMLGSSYQRARLTSFLNPSQCAKTTCWQYHQGQLALGSGGLFGDGLGHSVGKDGWLPEAQTDFILAVVGEELGVVGIFALLCLYGLIAYAGLRTARRARSPYEKLLASGLTSLILCQGIINIFVVLGLAPLTGVPLPFMSYAPTNLCVMLASVGLLLNIARPSAQALRAVGGPGRQRPTEARDAAGDRDRGRRDGRARGAGAGRGRRAAV